jgi:hypothetical protein
VALLNSVRQFPWKQRCQVWTIDSLTGLC